jgi:prevent-host-death family protein
MREIAISDFKATCIERLKAVATGKEELVVTLRGRPLAVVSPVPATLGRTLGGQAGTCIPADGDWSALLASDMEDDWA